MQRESSLLSKHKIFNSWSVHCHQPKKDLNLKFSSRLFTQNQMAEWFQPLKSSVWMQESEYSEHPEEHRAVWEIAHRNSRQNVFRSSLSGWSSALSLNGSEAKNDALDINLKWIENGSKVSKATSCQKMFVEQAHWAHRSDLLGWTAFAWWPSLLHLSTRPEFVDLCSFSLSTTPWSFTSATVKKSVECNEATGQHCNRLSAEFTERPDRSAWARIQWIF